MILRILFIVWLTALSLIGQQAQDLEQKSKIAFTPHNLVGKSVLAGSDSTVQDFTLCRYCHTPSKLNPVEALWSRKGTVASFDDEKIVKSSDQRVLPSDPGSRSCLYCHDGSLAKGFPHKKPGGNRQVSLLSTNDSGLPNHQLHLFSFPDKDRQTHLPGSESLLMVDESGVVSCLTCHDPHNNEHGNFLRTEAGSSQICFDCHEMVNWELSTHGNPADPRFADLKKMTCTTCHSIHALPADKALLKTDENALCLSCHDGKQDTDNEIASEGDLEFVFNKPFRHPIWNNPPGSSSKGALDTWSSGLGNDRAVACSDCHNPHAATDLSDSPFLDGTQRYVSGVDNHGFPKDVANYEYETCYKCHGMSQSAPFGADVARLLARTNVSFHPVEAPGNNPYVPSLKAEWSEQSMLSCTDCHGNDDVLEPQGPHGSNIPHILKAAYSDLPFAAPEENALCFRCHEEQRILQSDGFKFHRLHIQGKGYACSACHDPHGSIEYPGLMDLNKSYIRPLNGVLEVVQTEPGHGYCTLKCHDKAHPGQTY